MARINKTQFAVLGLLTRKSMSGYDIKMVLERMANFYWSESNAQLYPMLKKLEQDGMVTSSIDESSGARQRRIYAITPLGQQFLRDWLLKPVAPSKQREEFFLKLQFAPNLSTEETLGHIKQYQEEVEDRLQLLDTMMDRVQEELVSNKALPFAELILEHYQMLFQAKLAWCERAMKKLNV